MIITQPWRWPPPCCGTCDVVSPRTRFLLERNRDSSFSATVWKAVKSPQSRHKDRPGEQHPPRPGAFCSVQARAPTSTRHA
ncbi:hypothetical protein MTO96_006732 [Rhipicephalus appendiculatus]